MSSLEPRYDLAHMVLWRCASFVTLLLLILILMFIDTLGSPSIATSRSDQSLAFLPSSATLRRESSSLPVSYFEDKDLHSFLSMLESSGNLNGAVRYAVDFGANNGLGPTQTLFQQQGYDGLLVEGNPIFMPSLKSMFPEERVKKVNAYITPFTAMDLLRNSPLNPFFFKIDIDADDCATIAVMLQSGFQPRVIQMEFTYDIPWPWAFSVYPLSHYAYTVHYGFQSCSLAFAWALMKTFEYSLVSVGGTKDLIFVHELSMKGLVELDPEGTSLQFGSYLVSCMTFDSLKLIEERLSHIFLFPCYR